MAVFAGGSAAIKKAHIAKATSDLHNFQIAVEMTLNETPRVANIATETKKAQLESIMDALNDNLAADYKLTAVDGTLTGNITKTAATTDDASFIICRSDKTDSWGNPYFVIIDRAERGGSSASEFYMTTVTAGPNAILHLDGAIDGDDVFSLTSYADGDVISATYNMAEAAPTVVGGAEAATSYTAVMTAPVNNGVTVGWYVAPETPAQDPQQGGGNEPAAKQTPAAPTLSATSGTVTVGNTTSFTVSRQGTGAVSAVSANESVATVSVSGTTVTVTGVAAGTTTISVSVGEDSTYLASSPASYSVVVDERYGRIIGTSNDGSLGIASLSVDKFSEEDLDDGDFVVTLTALKKFGVFGHWEINGGEYLMVDGDLNSSTLTIRPSQLVDYTITAIFSTSHSEGATN